MHDSFWIFRELTSNYMCSLNNVKYNVNRNHGAQKESHMSTTMIVFGLCTNFVRIEEEIHHTNSHLLFTSILKLQYEYSFVQFQFTLHSSLLGKRAMLLNPSIFIILF